MQVLGIVTLVVAGLLMLAIAATLLPPIFSFRSFDYRKVSYRVGVLFAIVMPLSMLGASLHHGEISPLRTQAVLQLLLLMVIAVLIAVGISYISYRQLRAASEMYAEYEAKVAERRRCSSSSTER